MQQKKGDTKNVSLGRESAERDT